MRHNADHSEDALPAVTSKSDQTSLRVVVSVLIVGALAITLILYHRSSVNNALEIGQCLAEKGAKGLNELLRHFLHHAYRWIFKACG